MLHKRKREQRSRADMHYDFTKYTNPFNVYDALPEGMQLGDRFHLEDGRSFVCCQNTGAAAVTIGKMVSMGATQYAIDGTNEVIIPQTDSQNVGGRTVIEWYLGASGTTLTNACIGGYIGVISSTGVGVYRRITDFQEFVYDDSGTDRVAYRVLLEEPLNLDLAATSVCEVFYNEYLVTLYNSGANNAGFCLLGGSACDVSVAQNKYFFVQISGIGMREVDGAALIAGQEFMGSNSGANGDGNVELNVSTDLVPAAGVALYAIADGVIGFVKSRTPNGTAG